MIKNILIGLVLTLNLVGLTSCSMPEALTQKFNPTPTTNAPQVSSVKLSTFPNEAAFWQGDAMTVWGRLQQIPLKQLQAGSTQTTDPSSIAWIDLAVISKQYSMDTSQLVSHLSDWRAKNPNHPGNALFPNNSVLSNLQSSPTPKHIVALLPLEGPLGASGKIVRDGILNAYYGAQSQLRNSQTISFIDTSNSTNLSATYQQAISQGADTIIGPLTKSNVQSLSRQGSYPVPTIALNYADVGWNSSTENFYQFGLSPQDEAVQMADKAWHAGRTRAIIIAPQSAWGQRMMKTLVSRWQALGGSVTDTLYFTPQTNFGSSIAKLLRVNPNADRAKMKTENNKETLQQQRRQDFDVVFLLAPPAAAKQIVPNLKFNYVDNSSVYATSIIFSGTGSADNADLDGINFCDTPWTLKRTRGAAQATNPNRLFAVGRDAYMLANQLSRLTNLPNFPLYGATGALSLTAAHQIYRRLPWAQLHDGHP